MTAPALLLARGTRVVFRRSFLCGREPEFGVVVKRHADVMDGRWYVVRDEHGSCSEHDSMIADATDEGWRAREVERLLADAEVAARRENESLSYRYQAEALVACAGRLAA